jgi:hypothetical protein
MGRLAAEVETAPNKYVGPEKGRLSSAITATRVEKAELPLQLEKAFPIIM